VSCHTSGQDQNNADADACIAAPASTCDEDNGEVAPVVREQRVALNVVEAALVWMRHPRRRLGHVLRRIQAQHLMQPALHQVSGGVPDRQADGRVRRSQTDGQMHGSGTVRSCSAGDEFVHHTRQTHGAAARSGRTDARAARPTDRQTDLRLTDMPTGSNHKACRTGQLTVWGSWSIGARVGSVKSFRSECPPAGAPNQSTQLATELRGVWQLAGLAMGGVYLSCRRRARPPDRLLELDLAEGAPDGAAGSGIGAGAGAQLGALLAQLLDQLQRQAAAGACARATRAR
jgi:hypothetical protein